MLKRFRPIMTFTKSFILKAVALGLTAVLFSSCRAEQPDTPIVIPDDAGISESTPAVIDPGGVLRIPMTASPYTMHPLYIKEAQLRNVYSIIFEPLISFNDLMEPAASIAESWKYEADTGNWVFKLRANVHWHNDIGLVTGADAAYTINTIISDPESVYYTNLSNYVETAYGYDNTLIIKAKTPSYALIYALNIPVIPKAYYEGKDKVSFDIPRGSGCFQVSTLSFENGTKMEMEAFTFWWKKLPYIERIVATGYSGQEAILTDFKNGLLDCVPSDLKTTEIYEILEGVDEISYLSHNYVFLGFNLNRGLMQNVTFRKAIAYAVNRTDIINNVYLKKATGAEQPLFNDSSLSSATVTRYDANVVYAQQLMADIGYTDSDNDGYIDINGNTLVLTMAVLNDPADPIRLEAAEYIAADLKEIGVKVNIVGETLEALKATVDKRNYDIILSGYALTDTPNLDFIFRRNGSGNLSSYSSTQMDGALDKISNADTLAALKAATLDLQNIVAADLPQIGLFFEMNTLLFTDRLSVSSVSRETNVYSNINTWYYK